jgi:hypothetical protein
MTIGVDTAVADLYGARAGMAGTMLWCIVPIKVAKQRDSD